MTKDFVDQCDTYSLCSRRLAHAADAGAAEDLKTFGADLATRARRASAAGDKTVLYGAASEAFRLAQEKPAAIAVAREGLRFIPAAKNTTTTGRIEVALQGEFAGDDDAVAPAIALYRAGARDEAVASGYLTGYARYRHAPAAGEAADPAWVIEPGAKWSLRWLIDDLIRARGQTQALRLYDALRCRGAEVYEAQEGYEWEAQSAVLAALVGRAGSVRAHLARAATALDGQGFMAPLFAHYLAEDWRRALVVAERVGAKDDTFSEALCTGS